MFLFDTDTLNEILKRTPSPGLLAKLATMRSEDQFTTFITIGELVYGVHRSNRKEYLLRQFEERLLPMVHILPSIVPLLKPSVAFAPNWSEPGHPWQSRI